MFYVDNNSSRENSYHQKGRELTRFLLDHEPSGQQKTNTEQEVIKKILVRDI